MIFKSKNFFCSWIAQSQRVLFQREGRGTLLKHIPEIIIAVAFQLLTSCCSNSAWKAYIFKMHPAIMSRTWMQIWPLLGIKPLFVQLNPWTRGGMPPRPSHVPRWHYDTFASNYETDSFHADVPGRPKELTAWKANTPLYKTLFNLRRKAISLSFSERRINLKLVVHDIW